jgi:hypothetical protein
MKKGHAGTVKFLLERMKNYISLLQFIMVLWLFVADININPYLMIVLVAISMIVLVFADYKFVVEGEYSKIWEKNPKVDELFGKIYKNQELILHEIAGIKKQEQ